MILDHRQRTLRKFGDDPVDVMTRRLRFRARDQHDGAVGLGHGERSRYKGQHVFPGLSVEHDGRLQRLLHLVEAAAGEHIAVERAV